MSHLVLNQNSSNIVFDVRRREPELIPPAKPTPRELKPLSDIDDQEGLRFHIPVIQVYPVGPRNDHHQSCCENGGDPAEVIRAAIAEALVYYYPLAGRLREVGPRRKLAVDCTGEGVLFIEAEADVRLEEIGEEICPPFPCYKELLFNAPGSSGILHSPLVLIQVSRFLCGGFIFGIRINHTISDAGGLVQFMKAITEIARGAPRPSLLPVWKRNLLSARNPPQVICAHHEYDAGLRSPTVPPEETICQCFFFGTKEVSALRRLIPSHLQGHSTFDVLTACLWRCRTIALRHNPNEEVRVLLTVNARTKFNPPLPAGYYGNAYAYSTAITTAEKMSKNPPGYALELVRRAKNAITEEHMRSLLDFLVVQGRPKFTMSRSYLVSDTRAGFSEVDFGWGRPTYGGPANPTVTSFFTSYENSQGTKGMLVSVVLPQDAMEKFKEELGMMLEGVKEDQVTGARISSSL